MKPIIAVTSASQRTALNHSSGMDITLTNNAVINILVELGCIPIVVPNGIDIEDCEEIISKSDGLVLVGGQDISPSLYNQENAVNYSGAVSGLGKPYDRPAILKPDEKRDSIEKALYLAAREKKISVLGICRGMQLINAVEGGTLKQEIEEGIIEHSIEADGWINYHEIELASATKLRNMVGKDKLFISTIHHQCVDQVAENFIASAYSIDGMVEAIELDDPEQFVVGVQGHIEKSLKNIPEIFSIWKGFKASIRK